MSEEYGPPWWAGSGDIGERVGFIWKIIMARLFLELCAVKQKNIDSHLNLIIYILTYCLIHMLVYMPSWLIESDTVHHFVGSGAD